MAAAGSVALAACTKEPTRAVDVRIEKVPYGSDARQFAELRVPYEATPRAVPVVVLIHGGYWMSSFDLTAMAPLAQNLNLHGYATWNIEYRRVGEPGGGWTGTLADVANAVDLLPTLAPDRNLDLNRLTLLGHSAGSQLAFWAGSREGLPSAMPGAAPKVKPKALVSLSGVLDLALASSDGNPVLAKAVVDYLGGTPAQYPDRYQLASPVALLPTGVPSLLVHGGVDATVPVEQSRSYAAAAAAAGDHTDLVELAGADHFDVIRVDKGWWEEVVRWLPLQIGNPLL
jgi:acetyl esterase/lipase